MKKIPFILKFTEIMENLKVKVLGKTKRKFDYMIGSDRENVDLFLPYIDDILQKILTLIQIL